MDSIFLTEGFQLSPDSRIRKNHEVVESRRNNLEL